MRSSEAQLYVPRRQWMDKPIRHNNQWNWMRHYGWSEEEWMSVWKNGRATMADSRKNESTKMMRGRMEMPLDSSLNKLRYFRWNKIEILKCV